MNELWLAKVSDIKSQVSNFFFQLLCLDLGVQRLDIAEVAFKPRKEVLRVCIVKRC